MISMYKMIYGCSILWGCVGKIVLHSNLVLDLEEYMSEALHCALQASFLFKCMQLSLWLLIAESTRRTGELLPLEEEAAAHGTRVGVASRASHAKQDSQL